MDASARNGNNYVVRVPILQQSLAEQISRMLPVLKDSLLGYYHRFLIKNRNHAERAGKPLVGIQELCHGQKNLKAEFDFIIHRNQLIRRNLTAFVDK
jgi:hypothetical protein